MYLVKVDRHFIKETSENLIKPGRLKNVKGLSELVGFRLRFGRFALSWFWPCVLGIRCGWICQQPLQVH